MFKFYRMNLFNDGLQNDSTASPMSNKENDNFTVTTYQSVFYLCRTILCTKWKARINIEESYLIET